MQFQASKTKFVSDLHFGHKNILKYSNRPFANFEEMDDALVNNWNSVVAPGDTVFSLGDFSMKPIGYVKGILSRLNGNIHMITGNHDEEIQKKSKTLLEEGFVKEITSYKEITIGGQFICLFHYGMRVWNKSHYGSWLLYGHSHGNLPPYGKSVDVGVDSDAVLGRKEYRPLTFDEIKAFMDRRVIQIADHHTTR